MNSIDRKKNDVKEFWNIASCGEDLYLKGADMREAFNKQSISRYTLEPYILPFLKFHKQLSLNNFIYTQPFSLAKLILLSGMLWGDLKFSNALSILSSRNKCNIGNTDLLV